MSKHRPRYISPLTQARDTLVRFLTRPLGVFSHTTRFFVGFGLLAILTTLLLSNVRISAPADSYKEGDIVRRTIVSPADIDHVDAAETEQRRSAAAQAVRPILSFNPLRAEKSAQEFRAAWMDLQKQFAARSSVGGDFTWRGENIDPNAIRAIIAHRFTATQLDRLTEILRETCAGYIYDDADAENFRPEITLVETDNGNAGSVTVIANPQERMTALSTARQTLRTRIAQLDEWSDEQKTAIASAMLPFVNPSVVLNQTATEKARDEAWATVAPVAVSLKRNQVAAREGDTVTDQTLAQLAAIQAYGHDKRRLNHFVGLFLIVSALFWAAWKFTEHRSTTVSLALSKERAFGLVGLSVFVEVVLMRVGVTIADSISAQSLDAPLNDPTLLSFAIPFAAAALLVVMLVDTQLALITGFIVTLFAALLAPEGVPVAVYAMVSSSAAIYGIERYRERQSVTLAGLFTGGVNALMALALLAYSQQPLTITTILLALGCGVASGLLTAIFAAGGLPINESLFGILTDVKLLELSNADLPVLSHLALRAPGTNQHSHAVGQLAEDAARAVGANPLLVRIGALYHDIGKLAAPDMFVENQHGDNPHDRIRPSNSARIITSHVTYGLKLAKEIGLPKKIADFIPEHHGTRTLHYFLRKAQAQAADGEEVNEAEFRYPGPKPQFKETAIMMLADSCEAAARSLARPDPENIRAIVSKIVDAIISDGQLDECDITLRELKTIRETLIAALIAIYHARVDYPGFNPPPLTGALPPLPLAELDTEERGMSYTKASEIPIDKGGEVEDEAVTRKAARH
ncbi:MAG: HD family phosphohydrolase [Pyrinomonadaceae bacterium]